MRIAVTESAVRGAGIALLHSLAVRAFLIIGGLIGMTAGACGFRNAFRMRIALMLLVARGTRHRRVRAFGNLLLLLVTGGAVGLGARGSSWAERPSRGGWRSSAR